MYKNKKIFITGGAGYVGSVLVPILLDQGYKVTVFDLFIYGESGLKNQNLKFVKGDIRDIEALKQAIPGHDLVLHMACVSNDPSFDLDPLLGKEVNYDAFRPLVEISKSSSVNSFINISSSSVYGLKSIPNVYEESSLEPLTDYSKYKVDCEKILASYTSDSFRTVSLRPATVCGYSPRQRFDVVVNILTNQAYNNKKIIVFGGEQLRPNIHIRDLCKAISMLITFDMNKISGEIFNIGANNLTINEIAKIVKRVIDNGSVIHNEPINDLRSYHIASSKIKDSIGFEPLLTVEDAVNDLKSAFESNLLPNSLNDPKYFNIKKMQNIKLK